MKLVHTYHDSQSAILWLTKSCNVLPFKLCVKNYLIGTPGRLELSPQKNPTTSL